MDRETKERLEHIDREMDKLLQATRDLIVVGRTCLDSIKELRANQEQQHAEWLAQFERSHHEWEERDRATQDKLNILIDTVDKIIRSKGGNGSEHIRE